MAHKWEMSMERWWNGTDGEMNMERWWNCTDGRNEHGVLVEWYRRGK